MSYTKHPLIIANWKMNPSGLNEAKAIAKATVTIAKKNSHATVVACVPHIYLTEVHKITHKSPLHLGAQNCHVDVKGAYTGEHAGVQLKDVGAEYVILGHSERRKLGESNELIAKKVLAATVAKLHPIVCVGEETRDTQGNFLTMIETQVVSALSTLPKSRLKDVVIAYEPIWAIGTGATATVADVEEMQMFIKKVLTKQFDRSIARNVRIVYGGSVNADNAHELYAGSGVDGFLVGGASLKPVDFGKIVSATK
jgi:triosephosphate isomerase (TIM)